MKAIIELDVPDYQIGQEVSIYFKDTMMIKAIVQQPCEDAISRQTVLDMMQMRMSGKELYKAVYDLPPVNPQPCCDLISRKAILEEFENDQYHLEFCKEHHIERSISMEMVRIRLHDLPPVNPQPCENAISRQTVLDIVDSYSESQSNVEDVTQDIISDIIALPPVNSQPKTGRWISLDDFRGKYNERGFKCSECDEHSSFEENFCPGCGAKMVEPTGQESEKDEHMTADEFAELFTESEELYARID